MHGETWIPIVMFIGLTIIFCVLFWFRYRSRHEMQETIRMALDKGHELTPEIIDRLGHPQAAKDKDMRLGVIWLAIAFALVAFGYGIPDDDATKVFRGISAFPLALGIAYLILHKFTTRD